MKTTKEQNLLYKARFEKNASSFFNEQIKREYVFYLNRLYGHVQYYPQTIALVFKKSAQIEKYYDKDLFDFSLRELELFFYSLQPKSLDASQNYVSMVLQYIDWAIENKYAHLPTNLLSNVTPEWKRQFGYHLGKNLWTENEMIEIIKSIPNAQYAVIISLLFNGVNGKDLSELSNLKVEDVDFENKKLKLECVSGEKREVYVDDLCLKTIREAIKQSTIESLTKLNSENRKKISELTETKYVLRKSINKASIDDRVGSGQIRKRIIDVSNWFKEEFFNAGTIENSRILKIANDLYWVKGKFDEELLEEVYKRLGKEALYSKRKRMEKQFLNEETLRKIYKF